MNRLARIASVAALISCASLGLGDADAATLAGQIVRPGGTLDIRFPVDKSFQDAAAEGGNPRPTQGRALIGFPKGFDPARTWPILVVLATTDAGRTNIMDAPFYQAPAMSEGWIVLASDATISTRLDSTSWRLAHLAGRAASSAQRMAAVRALASGVCWLVWRRKTQRRDRSDAGEHERGKTVRIFSRRNQ